MRTGNDNFKIRECFCIIYELKKKSSKIKMSSVLPLKWNILSQWGPNEKNIFFCIGCLGFSHLAKFQEGKMVEVLLKAKEFIILILTSF